MNLRAIDSFLRVSAIMGGHKGSLESASKGFYDNSPFQSERLYFKAKRIVKGAMKDGERHSGDFIYNRQGLGIYSRPQVRYVINHLIDEGIVGYGFQIFYVSNFYHVATPLFKLVGEYALFSVMIDDLGKFFFDSCYTPLHIAQLPVCIFLVHSDFVV